MTIARNGGLILALLLLFAACVDDDTPDTRRAPVDPNTPVATTTFDDDATLPEDSLERGRFDSSWRNVEPDTGYVSTMPDTTRGATAPRPPDLLFATVDTLTETLDDISIESLNGDTVFVPIGGDTKGPSVLRVQLLLDRAHFSPGIIDGRWGKNTEKAVYWLQKREGLNATGEVDSTTYLRLLQMAGTPADLIVERALTQEDVAGPFVEIPDDIYEKAELDCMCYESLSEKLAEQYHVAPSLLRQLNPDVTLDSLQAGDRLWVPDVSGIEGQPSFDVDHLVISEKGFYVHAVDASNRIVYHFPSTLGSSYDPSPQGAYRVESITEDPWWHYQPDILAHVPDDEEEARIPPGPNNAVGKVWMALSEPHYGIHGTSAPETIGYATSAGCVRLTNWDALFLARHIEPGIDVHFRDTSTGAQEAEPVDSTATGVSDTSAVPQ